MAAKYQKICVILSIFLALPGRAGIVLDVSQTGGTGWDFYYNPGNYPGEFVAYTAYPYQINQLVECYGQWGYTNNGSNFGGYTAYGCTGNSRASAISGAVNAMAADLNSVIISGQLGGVGYIGIGSNSVAGQVRGRTFSAAENLPVVRSGQTKPNDSCGNPETAVETSGNPIATATGVKVQFEPILERVAHEGLLTIGAMYSSAGGNGGLFGAKWSSQYSAGLQAAQGRPLSAGTVAAGLTPQVLARRDDGTSLLFRRQPDGSLAADQPWKSTMSAAANWGFMLNDYLRNTVDLFDATGHITARYSIDGKSVVISRSGTTIGLTSQHGRTMSLQIGQSGFVEAIVDPAGSITGLSYAASPLSLLTSIAYPDGTTRSFQYGDHTYITSLTGIVDETGGLSSSWAYDQKGRAVSSTLGGGVGQVMLSYPTDRQPVVTNANGSSSQFVFMPANDGRALRTGQSQPAGSGCTAAAAAAAFDAQANLISSDDFVGARTCFNYDAPRKLELVRVSGLNNSANCGSYTASNSTLPAGARKLSTLWHPDWRLPVAKAEPGRIITFVYNGQPNPLNGGAVAACAPAGALLPNGKPIVVLCARIEQATNDTNGSQGFAAGLANGISARIWQWSYNSTGQQLTQTDPLGRIEQRAYYTDTTSNHTAGDLQASTNALGQSTQYTGYTAYGLPLHSTDPNGIVTDYGYDLRRRLRTVSVAGAVAMIDYFPNGRLRSVTSPDGSTMAHYYDAAQRLIAVSDGAGNRVNYTLDNDGNRILEEVKDASGSLTQRLTRTMDALGQVQEMVGRQ